MDNTFGMISEESAVRGNLSLREAQKQDPARPEPVKNQSFEGFLMAYWNDIKDRDIIGERARYYQMFMAQEFYQGRQYGFWRGGTYQVPDPNRDGIYYQVDYYGEQVRALLTQWTAAEIKLIVMPAESSAKGQAAARAASVMAAYYQRKFQTATSEQMTGLRAILQGGYLFYTFFDPEAKCGSKYKIPVYGSKQVPNPGRMWNCLTCGGSGMASELESFPMSYQGNPVPGQESMESDPMAASSPQNLMHEQGETPVQEMLEQLGSEMPCPLCQSPVELVGPESIEQMTVEGYEEGNKGEVVSIDVDGYEVGLHPLARACDPATTPWLYYRFRCHKAKLKSIYPWYKAGQGYVDKGLAYQRRTESILGSFVGGQQLVGWSRTGVENDTSVVTLLFLRPYTYMDFVYEEDTELVNGEIIPIGTRAIDKWPDGVMVVVVDDKVLDILGRDIDDHWSGGAYWPLPNSNWGLGAWNSLWQQRLINDAYNFWVEAVKHTTATQRLYNASVMDGNMIGNNPSNLVPITNLGPDADLSKVMHFVAGPEPPASIIQFIQQGKMDMQSANGATAALLGQSQANVSATDARQSKDAALANASLPTRIKGQVYAKRMEQTLRLCKKHLLFSRAFPLQLDSDYTRLEVQEFSAADLDVDMYVTFADHSAIPTFATDKRNNFVNALNNGAYNEELKPALRRRICEVFDEPYTANESNLHRRKAEIRLTAITALVDGFYKFQELDPVMAASLLEPEMQLVPDPMTGQPIPSPGLKRIVKEILNAPETKISLEFDDHNAMMEWCVDWGNSDRGIFADGLLYEIITARFHEHRNAAAQVNQANSAQMALANQPAMQAAQSFPQLGGAALPATATAPPDGNLATAGSKESE